MTDRDHVIYKNDPVLFRSYVDKCCTVTATDDSVHSGIVYTVDPVTESIVLVEEAHTALQRLKFVMGHAVRHVVVSSNRVADVPRLFPQPSLPISPAVASERKLAVMNILRENRFPISEAGDRIVMKDAFAINPPYAADDCESPHPAVLQSVRKILSQLT